MSFIVIFEIIATEWPLARSSLRPPTPAQYNPLRGCTPNSGTQLMKIHMWSILQHNSMGSTFRLIELRELGCNRSGPPVAACCPRLLSPSVVVVIASRFPFEQGAHFVNTHITASTTTSIPESLLPDQPTAAAPAATEQHKEMGMDDDLVHRGFL